MKYLKFFIVVLIFFNLSSFGLVIIGPIFGSIASYATFILISLYYFLNKKRKPTIVFIILGFLYFTISVIVNSENAGGVILVFVKYIIFVIMGASIVRDMRSKEIYLVLLAGSLSVLYEAFFVTNIGGRYSGFYLNPNSAGLVCILGYSFSYAIDNKFLKILGQILFSIAGILTFSRTFLLIWVIINLLTILLDYKNIYKIILSVFLLSTFLSLSDNFDFNARRLEAFTSILDGEVSSNMEEDSRTETWANFYDRIYENPLFGNGYLTFSGRVVGNAEDGIVTEGVHNTYLMIIGEAGIFVFLLIIFIYTKFIVQSIKYFNCKPYIFFIAISLFLFLMTSHNYFDNYIVLFVSLWIYFTIEQEKKLNMKRTQNFKIQK